MGLHRKGIQVARFHELFASEQRSAALYTRLARAVKGEQQNVLAVLPFLERAEHVDAGRYRGDADATAAMAIDERSHARVLTHLRESDTTDDPRSIRRRERWHRGDRSGALRAAVFGVNDGLVSNTSLVMGFAGSGASSTTILFAGLAGLMAGAFSMSVGEYISMRSQKESYEREISLESEELRDDPEAEREELALIYRAKGLDTEEARRVATTIMKNSDAALDTMGPRTTWARSRPTRLTLVGRDLEPACVRVRRGFGGTAVCVRFGSDRAVCCHCVGGHSPVRGWRDDGAPQREKRVALWSASIAPRGWRCRTGFHHRPLSAGRCRCLVRLADWSYLQ